MRSTEVCHCYTSSVLLKVWYPNQHHHLGSYQKCRFLGHTPESEPLGRGHRKLSVNKPWRWFWRSLKFGAIALINASGSNTLSVCADVAGDCSSNKEQKDTSGWREHTGYLKGVPPNPYCFVRATWEAVHITGHACSEQVPPYSWHLCHLTGTMCKFPVRRVLPDELRLTLPGPLPPAALMVLNEQQEVCRHG